MGKVVELSHYREPAYQRPVETFPIVSDSKVPIEFAVGNPDREACLRTLARYKFDSVQEHSLRNSSGQASDASFCMISVKDAISLNKRILEQDDLSDEEIANHIDIIQMLENLDLSMMEKLWSSFTTTD